MPELPEVEAVARSLARQVTHSTITRASVLWPRTVAIPPPEEFVTQLPGRRIEAAGRRGKYVILWLDRGALLFHLKMSGQLLVVQAEEALHRHTRLVLDLDDGRQLRFWDRRKFGRAYLVDNPMCVTARLGPEPLADDLSMEEFSRLLARRSGRLKSVLLNQEFLAGLGNIYADEVLFAAHLHPLRKANSLSPAEQARLYEAIRTILAQAVASGGTTLSDRTYVNAEGQAGAYQNRVAVYGRTNRACPACGSPIERIVLGARSTHFCPRCQR